MTDPQPEREPADAQCPKCGYMTLRLIAGTMVCDSGACGYEHKTMSMPIIPRPRRH